MVMEVQKWAWAVRFYGPWGAVKKFFTYNDVKAGVLVGTDKAGNKYFEDKKAVQFGRDRWVDYNQHLFPRDTSKIPPEWHAWLHRLSDHPPTSPKAALFYANRPSYVWQEHGENYTGTDKAYRPYSTTRPKIQPWQPPKGKAA